jgi:hypothetical protein
VKTLIQLITIIFAIVLPLMGHGQTGKHPRALDLEKALTKEASELIKTRFPTMPFIATVSVEPVHRSTSNGAKEKLPYFDSGSDEIVDEWDDPSQSNAALLNRVKKVNLSVSISDAINDNEMAELQQSLLINLGLIPVRDTVEVKKRSWQPSENGVSGFKLLGIGLAIWLGLLLVAGLTIFPAVKSINKAIAKFQTQGSAPAPATSAPVNASSRSGNETRSSSGFAGDIRMNDPIAIRKLTKECIDLILLDTAFPNLEDMIQLQHLAESSPASLGALLAEFPVDSQKTLFELSYGDGWLEAINHPGETDGKCLDAAIKLSRRVRDLNELEWQRLLITTWRLNDKMVEFVKSIKQEEAITLLYHMPKAIGVSVGKNAFPGSWASILDTTNSPSILEKNRIQDLQGKCEFFRPYRSTKLLEKYRIESDLLKYLRGIDPQIEKEIYSASRNDSMIHSLRPPFYKVTEFPKELVSKIVPQVSLENWAVACFNISKSKRKIIESCFNEKQLVRFSELLKDFDKNPPSHDRLGDVREQIGRLASQIIKEESAKPALAAVKDAA